MSVEHHPHSTLLQRYNNAFYLINISWIKDNTAARRPKLFFYIVELISSSSSSFSVKACLNMDLMRLIFDHNL